MAERLRLKISNGELQGRIFEVKAEILRLGRSSSNDIHISDEELSRNHCLFEQSGETGVRLTDLASANGTFRNGSILGNDPVELQEGDLISVGSTTIEVIGEGRPAAAGSVDLGLGVTGKIAAPAAGKRRAPLVNILWLVAVIVAAAAIYLVLNAPKTEETSPKPVADEEPRLVEVLYERVSANQESIFRYELNLSPEGVLSVRVDDVPAQNRHHGKSKPLSDTARAELQKLLAFSAVKDIDRDYVGIEPDPPALESYRLQLVYDTRARLINIVNTQEPEAFRLLRERLEAFSKSELGIWAIQYPKEKLIELASAAVELADSKWQDRDVNYGNIHTAITAYREALVDLETVEPRPELYKTAADGLKRAEEELNRRFSDQRFLADKALNLGQFDTAKKELSILLEMVPDRNDERYRDVNNKLLETEKRLNAKGGR